jgi:hypothetical protein
MKRITAVTLLVAGVVALGAAEPKEAVKQAIDKLKAQPNYSWTAKLEMPGSQFTPGPTKGQTQKDGFTLITQEMNDNTAEAVLKGEKAAVKVEDEWKLASELEPGGGNRGAFMARILARTKPAAEEAADLLGKVKDLKPGEAGLCSGDLTEEAAKDLLTMGRRRPNADNAPPPPKNAKGSVKFWVKDGMLFKYESTIEGTVTFREEERDVKRIRTVEIQDVGKTKVDVPAEAKKKLS